jgi:enoyl-CoA hydratase/carnithine racemase
MGGGMEILLNMDLVFATSRARFALPEVLRGVVAAQGGIPRLLRLVGHARASELLLTGRTFQAEELREMGLVNKVVPVDVKASPEEGQKAVVAEALRYAKMITSASPDSVRVTKQALRFARDGSGHIDQSTLASVESKQSRGLYAGRNFREGLTAFKEVSRG